MEKSAVGSRPDLVVVVEREKLARACAVRGWSYRELGLRSGLSRPTLQAVRRGRPVRPRTYHKLVRALHATPAPEASQDLLARL